MVALQIISKVLATKDLSVIEDNLLTKEYFVGYEDEYEFLINHEKEYGSVPDKATFLSKFPEVDLVTVEESDRYLVDTIREEYLYYKSVPVVQKVAELLKTDANAAAEYMVSAIQELQPNYQLGGTNIISDAEDRYNQFIERKDHQQDWFFTSGFEELDDLIHGIQRAEEFILIFARTNQGKSWVLEKICTHVWQIGFNVGYISPEMTPNSIGYRFDTLYKNFSNTGLMWGKDDIEDSEYKDYINELATKQNKFIVATPRDFDRKITVTKLKNWCSQYKLDLIAVDGIKYMTDERYKRGDNLTTTLTNISEDLMALSNEIGVPILVVAQANRGGVKDDEQDGTPDLETVRDSDGIAQNASKVLSIRQTKDNILQIEVKKQRFGPVGGKLLYHWNIDKGDFELAEGESTSRRTQENKKPRAVNKEDVF